LKKIFSFAFLLVSGLLPAFSHAQCSASSGVNFCTPTNGGGTGTSVQVSAGGASNIVAMMLYVDGRDPAAFTAHSNRLSTSLNLSAGAHNLVVNGWDNPGNVYQKSININVSSSGSPTPTPTPAPSSCPPISTGVRVCWPSNGGSTGSPVQIIAGATAGSGIAAMKIYVDDQDRYTVNSNSISTALPMSSGGHYVVVQAWDNNGNVYKTPVNVAVGGGSNPTPAPTPTPTGNQNGSAAPVPSGAIVMSNIQNQSGWQTCGGCGNQGGSGTGPSYGLVQHVSSPSLSGNAANFYVNGGPAWTGAYWFIEQPVVPRPVSYLRYEFDMYVPSSATGVIQAIEFECQQNANGYTYNYAWQADYGSNTWRVFNYTNKSWEGTSIPLQRFAPNTWHHIIAIYHASGNSAVHDSLTVDGVTKNVNIWHNATHTGNGSELTNAFQLDLMQSGAGYKVYLDNIKVSLTD
jgi:hypothetical protein